MRDIKFRAWNKGINKMFPAEELGNDELTINPDGRGFVNVSSTTKQNSQYYPHMIPMQYTGLKDKNGVEIYEGDTLKSSGTMVFSNPEVQRDLIRTVKMLSSGFTLVKNNEYELPNIVSNISNYTFWNTQRDWVIIGNIYENPELLI